LSRIEAEFQLRRKDFELKVELALPDRGVSVLFGQSGCGKTTVLRCVAGLTRAEKGWLKIGDECWQDSRNGLWLPPHKRPIGYVFQEASLFPHLSVRDNLDFALRRSGVRRATMDRELVSMLDIGPLMDRMPDGLSGGERQRVAIARALSSAPRILLMDEPMAALDEGRKNEILPFLERLHRQLSIPVLYVTHSIDEVVRLADHLVLMEGGSTVVSGPLGEVMASLDSPLARSSEAGVMVEARVAGHDQEYGLTRLDIGGIDLWAARVGHPVGEPLRVRIHARDVSLALFRPDGSSITNILPAVVESIACDGEQCLVRLRIGSGARLLSRITRRSRDLLALESGIVVYAQIKAVVPIV